MYFEVEKKIFELFPGMRIVAIVADGISEIANEKIIREVLNRAWQSAGEAAKEYGNPQSHPYIKAWGERMKAVGVSRKKFPSSVEALVRRAGRGGDPVSISPIVDFYNSISLKYLVPAGGFDIDELRDDLLLRLSKKGDTFHALDSTEKTEVFEGEVSYADGNVIITRHFVWKQSRHAILTPKSRKILFVSEILGELPPETAQNVGDAITKGLSDYFNIKAKAEILDLNKRIIEI